MSSAEPQPPPQDIGSREFEKVLLSAFGTLPESGRVPASWWSEQGKIYGLPLALRCLWQASGLARAVDDAASHDKRLAETVFRSVSCAVCQPAWLSQAHRWIWGLSWTGSSGKRTSSREVTTAMRLLEESKPVLEHALYLEGRSLFDLCIDHAFLVSSENVVVLFREQARPVAFEVTDGSRESVVSAAQRLLWRFTPGSSELLEGELFAEGLKEVFSLAAPHEIHDRPSGLQVAAFLSLVLLAELRRRLPEDLSTTEALDGLCQIRALEVALGPRRYLVRQPLSGAARRTFRALGIRLPRRVTRLDAAGNLPA